MNLSSRLFLVLSLAPLVAAQTQFSTDVLALNPLGFWTLNGNANDASGHGNNGALRNGVTFTSVFPPPVEAQAAVFDRSQGQFISLSAQGSSSFNLASTHAFTAMAWVRTLGLRHMAIMSKADANAGWTFGIDSGAGRFSLLFLTGGQLVLGVESTVAVNDGAWHLVAMTYDGSAKASGVRLYVDGMSVGASVASDALGNGSILNSGPLTIGGESDGSDAFEGNMNDAAIFGAALTPAQILQLATDTGNSKAILAQFAFGGGWYSAVYFTNTSLTDVSFPVSFTADNGSPLTVTAIGGSSKTITLAAGASIVIEAPNVGSQIQQGYVSATLPPGVTGYGVFRQSVPGVPDQEAVALLSPANGSNVPLVYDETKYITGVAIVNPGSVATTVTVTVTDNSGSVVGTSTIVLPPFNKTEAALRSLPGLSQVAGKQGTARFTVTGGAVIVLGLRFNGVAFTSIPTDPQSQIFKFISAP